jgi:hypothetical protein
MGRRKMVRILMETGTVDVSIKNQQGETPVDIAVRKRFSEIVETIRNPPKATSASISNGDRDQDADEGDHQGPTL